MPPDFRLLLQGALLTGPSLIGGCNKPPPAVAPEVSQTPASSPDEGSARVKVEREPGDDDQPPRVASAQFINPQRIRLTFTEPLAPSTEVNPRQFRISVSYLSVDDVGYGYATYSDVKYHQGDEESQLIVRGLTRYTDERVMGLDLSEGVPVEICSEIKENEREVMEAAAYAADNPDAERGEEIEMGLYLHYTSRGSAPVSDLAGNGLEPFGAAWALNYGARYVGQNGQMPVARLDLLVEVPCFDLPDDYDYDEDTYDMPGGVPSGVQGGVPGGVPGGVSSGSTTAKPAPPRVKTKPRKR